MLRAFYDLAIKAHSCGVHITKKDIMKVTLMNAGRETIPQRVTHLNMATIHQHIGNMTNHTCKQKQIGGVRH